MGESLPGKARRSPEPRPAADAGPDGTLYRTDFTGGVFASADGLSWNPVGEGLEGMDVVALWIDPEDPGVLYVGTGNHGLWVLEP